MKKLMFVLIALTVLSACSNTKKSNLPTPSFDLTQLEEMAPKFVNQEVVLQGIIDHVCKHGGKRMFIVGSLPSARIRIDAGEELSFDASLEGSTAYITGILEELRIDNAYLDKWEQEIRDEMGGEAASKVHMGEEGHEDHDSDADHDLQRITDYRTAIIDSGKEYLSFYSVKCISYQVAEDEADEKE
jgi:hypothetical protein